MLKEQQKQLDLLTKLVAKMMLQTLNLNLFKIQVEGDFHFKVQDEDEAEEVEVVVKEEHAMVVVA